jgi:prepilin-type N-terminal cleavage/methylation domain-containing protein
VNLLSRQKIQTEAERLLYVAWLDSFSCKKFLRSLRSFAVTNSSGFSLIELMIVIVILGALVAIIVPMFSYSESDAKDDAVTSEMRAIQSAYIDFYNDNFPHNGELGNLSFYGLYPLCFTNEPAGYSGAHGGTWSEAVRGEYDPYNNLGWNGPYLMQEGTNRVDIANAGQEEDSGGMIIPIVKDPYGGYYRVLSAYAESEKMSLICTGRNRKLQTTSTDTNEQGWVEAIASGVDGDGDRYDDTALPLLPFK